MICVYVVEIVEARFAAIFTFFSVNIWGFIEFNFYRVNLFFGIFQQRDNFFDIITVRIR